MDSLMRIVEQEGIYVSYRDLALPEMKLLGCYFYDPQHDQPFIMLDNSLKKNLALHRSVMAEELGHYFTIPQGNFLVPYTSYSRALILGRDERRALNWACDFLIPVFNFKNAIVSGIKTVDELAEHFNVSPWLVHRRIQFIEEKHPALAGRLFQRI